MNVKEFIKAVNRKYGSINNYLDSWKINVMNQYISNRNCSTPAVRRFLDGGISIKHSYHDMEGLQFHEVTVTVDSCK